MSDQTDVLHGTLDLLIMRTIALEPLHGWAIAQRIQQISNDLLRVQQGSLYPAPVLWYLIEQRTREIGVGMALGATRGSIGALVLSQSRSASRHRAAPGR